MQIPTSDPRLLDATFTEQSSNLARLAPVVKIMKMYQQRERTLLGRADSGLDGLPTTIIVTDLVLTLIWAPIIFLVIRGAGAEERMLRAAVRQRREESRRSELDAEIQQALDMTRTENAAYAVVSDALRICVPPDLAAEFLVADSSRDHFRQVSSTVPEGDPSGCAVGGPGDCPSAVRGQTHTFRSSARLDACPHLRVRANDTCSAVCVPVAIAGRSIGVFHVTAPNDAPPSEHTVQDLELVARKAGERLGMLRAFARTETEAHTDPLTGLLNRRSLESRVQELADLGSRYTIGFADLDHFKSLNTQFGHDAGDRALRIFSRTVRDAIRPYDLAARWGGEEFVVVFPDCGVADAKTVAERVRHLLAQVLEHGDAPQFTVSIGLAEAHIGSTFRDVVAHADAALMEAKTAGRDRVVVSEADAGKLFTLPDPETPVAATGA